MTPQSPSEWPLHYLRWAKIRQRGAIDLATSGVKACALSDLAPSGDDLAINGPNDEGYAPLMEAIATRYGLRTGQIVTATGTSGANFLVFGALLKPGDEVLIEQPGYGPLVAVPQYMGATIKRFQRSFERQFGVDAGEIVHAITPRTKLVVLTNPHNPTGAVLPGEVLREIGSAAARVGASVLVDEVYLDGVWRDRPGPAASLGAPFISTNSLTKIYGLAGLRCGWVAAPLELAGRIREMHDIVDGTGPVPTEMLGVVAIRKLDQLGERSRRLLAANMEIFQQWMHGQERLEWIEPSGGTVGFPRFRDLADSEPFIERLLNQQGISLVPGKYFDLPAHFRCGLGGDTTALVRGLDGLGQALRGC